MVNSTESITIFTPILEKASRRELYIPSVIDHVTWYSHAGVTTAAGGNVENSNFSCRIPFIGFDSRGKEYVPYDVFKNMEPEEAQRYWTIHEGDYILNRAVHPSEPVYDPVAFFQKELHGTVSAAGIHARLFTVSEFSENIYRGSNRVKHWLIKGA